MHMKDTKGYFFRWSLTGKHYYYLLDDADSKLEAYKKALKQQSRVQQKRWQKYSF